jgi:hypothetical protein
MQKRAPQANFCLNNACLYAENAQKMKNFWFKKCKFGAVLLKNGKI